MRIERVASVAGQGTGSYQPREHPAGNSGREGKDEDGSGEFGEHLKRMRITIDLSKVHVEGGVIRYDAWR